MTAQRGRGELLLSSNLTKKVGFAQERKEQIRKKRDLDVRRGLERFKLIQGKTEGERRGGGNIKDETWFTGSSLPIRGSISCLTRVKKRRALAVRRSSWKGHDKRKTKRRKKAAGRKEAASAEGRAAKNQRLLKGLQVSLREVRWRTKRLPPHVYGEK